MAYNFPYLKDSSFLQQFDKIKLKEQFVKIIVLDFHQNPIQQIQGKIISGSFNLDGSSAMRRTGNVNLVADNFENNLTDTKHLLSINKKIEVLIGFTNTTDRYQQYDMIWFPQGVYLIIAANISNSLSGINISLTLHDKMALLNGECGGTLPASIILSQLEDIDENGQPIIRQPTIYQIIQQLVNHFGGQQLGKIIISDIDNEARQVMKWTGSTPLYYFTTIQNGHPYYSFSTNYNELYNKLPSGAEIKQFNYGDDVGYILTDFSYPGDLISKAGDTICSILDQIKNVLGNYEYFYDINGNFIFQEIKNYLNKSYSNQILKNINKDNYLVDYTSGKSVYTFDDSDLIISISNSPQYQQIKNDFVIWGKRKSISGNEIPIRYHLAIDEKPKVGIRYCAILDDRDEDDVIQAHNVMFLQTYPTRSDFPATGQPQFYYQQLQDQKVYIWDTTKSPPEYTQVSAQPILKLTEDFRDQLYFQGVQAEYLGLDSNYYYTELKSEWPKLYDIKNKQFYPTIAAHPNEIDFFLDIINESQTDIGQYGVQNIGRRTVSIVDDSINCIFAPQMPDIVIIQQGTDKTAEQAVWCQNRNQPYVQVKEEIYNMLWEGGVLKPAYEEIKRELYQYTTFNEQVSLTTIPIYYLEPNTRITIRDSVTGIYGDFMIKSISMPLDINGTMSISCTKALERL